MNARTSTSKVRLCPTYRYFDTVLTLKQEHGESLSDFNKRFKQTKDNLEGVFSKDFMVGYIVKTTNYKNESNMMKKAEIKDKSFNTFCSYVYLKNSDNNKYGNMKKQLQTKFMLGNDQYPKTLSRVTDM